MIFQRIKNDVVILWDSIAETESLKPDTLKGAVNKARIERYLRDDRTPERSESWLGAPSLTELNNRLSKGWSDGVAKLEKLKTKELDAPASIRRRRVRGDQGDEVDMQAVWRGDLSRAWTRTRRASRTAVRSVSIVIDLGASAYVNSDELFWRGASALKVAETLQEAGYSVALYGAAHSKGCSADGKLHCVQFVEIKAEDAPMDMDKLAALTAMPGFFRTRLFSGFTYAMDREDKTVDEALGCPYPELIGKHIAALPIPQNALIQPKDVLSKAKAEAWIEQVLQQIESPELEAA